jgi:Bacterial PH domain
VTRFRYHSAIIVTAVLAAIAATPFLYEGMIALGELPQGASAARSLLVLVPLIPLAVAVWAWRAGTDANEYGIRVRALFGRKVVPWTEVSALIPDQRGRAVAELRSGSAIHLTAVKPGDLPRLAAASGKQVTPAT